MIAQISVPVKHFLCVCSAELVGVNFNAGAHCGSKNAGADILTL